MALPNRADLQKMIVEMSPKFFAGDVSSILEWIGPDCQWEENIRIIPDLEPVYVGPSGFEAWNAQMREAWEEIHVDPVEWFVVTVDDEEVFVINTRVSARGRDGIEVAMNVWNVMWTSDLVLLRRRIYLERDEAVRDAHRPNSDFESGED